MIKKLVFLGALILAPFAQAAPQVVAWDIHEVLCSKPVGRGYNCTPDMKAFQLVKELHSNGVRQVILSNISRKSFEVLKKRHPKLLEVFEPRGSLADSHFVFTRKPHGKYFKKFMKRHRALDPSDILFFDDKAENIKGARSFGIDGQLYCSPEQARKILVAKGLL